MPKSFYSEAAHSRSATAAAVDRGAVRQLQEQLGAHGVAQLMSAFFARTPGRLTRLRAAAGARDASKLREQACTLKGMARSFGAAEMGEIAARIERESVAGSLDHAEDLVAELAASFERTRVEMPTHAETSEAAPAPAPLPSGTNTRVADLERRIAALEQSVLRLLSGVGVEEQPVRLVPRRRARSMP